MADIPASDRSEERRPKRLSVFFSGIALFVALIALIVATDDNSVGPLNTRVARLEAVAGTGGSTSSGVAMTDVHKVVAQYVNPMRGRISKLEASALATAQRSPVTPPATSPADDTATEPEANARSRVFLDSNGAPLRLATVMAALDREGFRFENSPLTDGTQRYIALKHTTVVELYPESGTPHLYRIDIVGIASGDDQAANLVIVQAFRAAFNAVAPWGYAWWEENVESLIASAERSAENKSARTKFLDGVMAVIRVNAILPSYSLELRGGAPQ